MEKNEEASSGVNDALEPTIAERLANRAAIDAALNRAAREAVLDHARAGNSVATLQDDKVVWLPPDEVFALVAELDRKDGQSAFKK